MAEPAKNDAHIVEIPVSVDGGEAEATGSLEKAAEEEDFALQELPPQCGGWWARTRTYIIMVQLAKFTSTAHVIIWPTRNSAPLSLSP